MDPADTELITEFVIESQEGLANVENQLLEIESGGADIDTELVNAVFRTMHSIKGSAGFLGLDRIGSLAHGLEEVLDDMRNREVVPTSELVSSILRAADFMTGLIDAVESSHEADVDPFIEDLQKHRCGATSPESDVDSPPAADAEPETTDSTPAAAEAEVIAQPPAETEPVVEPVADPQPAAETPLPTPQPAAQQPVAEPTESAAPELDESVREFLAECFENLDKMDHDVIMLQQQPEDEDLLRNVFRTIHAVKGGAGFLGQANLEQLAHIAEKLVSDLRSGDLAWSEQIASALLATGDKCREGLRLVESGAGAEFEAQSAIQQLLDADDRNAGTKTDEPKQAEPKQERASEPVASQPTRSEAPAAEAPSTGAVNNDAGAVNNEPTVTEATSPEAPQAPAPDAAEQVSAAPAKPEAVPAAATPKATAAAETKSPAGEVKEPLATGESTIRVDVSLLDKLMTRVGELVLARNQILQHTNHQEDSSFVSTAQRLNLITTELQEDVMKTRMQPIGNVWAKFPRVVRDLSSQLGKKIRIEMEGKETELDKTIVEAIKDPLTHLVRNSVDHGIESPEVRVESGKPAEGCLSLRAYHEGGQVNIEISDDGAGLNLDRIRNKAIERGLINADQAAAMSEREAAQLILLPGFSTAEQVSSVSGRGVGMDVVKTNIERIGGTIDVQSRPAEGTTINIKIPLTLAIIPALIVTNGGDRYAIPQVSLLELVRLEGEQINGVEYVHGAPVYRLRGTLLPLVNLSERLGLTKAGAEDADADDSAAEDTVVNIVVLRANDRQFGLVVDGVNDTEEIVVKPLSRQLKCVSEYAGATIMGDGTVALILDVAGLASASGLHSEVHDAAAAHNASLDSGSGDQTQTLLVVDLGDSRRFAMPTSMVARLEKVEASAIEFANNSEVIQYRGDIMPLVRLAKIFGGSQEGEQQSSEIQIVVYADQDHTCGLVVNRIVDIVEADVQLQSSSGNDNLLGSTVIQNRVTDVLNMKHLAKTSTHPVIQLSTAIGGEL